MAEAWTRRFRYKVDIGVAYLDQTTFAELIEALENPCCVYTFGIGWLDGGPALFSYARALTEAAITEQLKGRTDLGLKPGEPVNELHRRIMGPVITHDLYDFEKAWSPVGQVRVTDAEVETNPNDLTIAGKSDAIVLVAHEVESGKFKDLIHIAYPVSTLKPALPDLTSPK